MSDYINPVAKINVTERKLEWLTESCNVKWETSAVVLYPDIMLYDQSTVEALKANVAELEETIKNLHSEQPL
jgi:hypothetical protein